MKHLFGPLELKGLDEAGVFSGYAAVFDGVDSQNDVVTRGAFARSIAEHKSTGSMPPLLWMHDASKPVGGLHSCSEDSKGLHVKGKLTLGVKQADEAYALLRDGAVTGMSIGYKARQSHKDKKTGARVLSDVDLREVSLVALPANPAARVEQVKSNGIGQDGLTEVLGDVYANTRVLSSMLELKRSVTVHRLLAPPLIWGPWTQVAAQYNGSQKYSIEAKSISDAPSSVSGQVKYWSTSGRQVVANFSGSIDVITEDSRNAVHLRFKSHSVGQILRATVTAHNQ